MGLKVLDLFSGIGGFSLGLERTGGFETAAFCEVNKAARSVLRRFWPGVPIHEDVRTLETRGLAVDLICGGDPCPIRSRARSNGASKHPDLSRYFLALVGRLRPEWVLRENVPAPDDGEFIACLEALGYRAAIIRADASPFTTQQRVRDFIVACHASAWRSFAVLLSHFENGSRPTHARLAEREVTPALTCHRTRYDSRDCYIWEPERSVFRILDRYEREALAGFPRGWLDGLSEATVARLCGNAVVPQIPEVIGRAILEARAA